MLTKEDKNKLKDLNLMLQELTEDYKNGEILEIEYRKLREIFRKINMVKYKIEEIERRILS